MPRGVENLITLKKYAEKIRIFQTLLKGQALSYFDHNLMRRSEAEDLDVPDNELIELVLRDIDYECIHKHACHTHAKVLYEAR
jgi:hypothetical protein